MAGRPKGTPRTGGRRKGTPNKLTRTIKEAIEASFDQVGGVDYLVRMAEEQPTAYMTLLGKVLPAQINANVTGLEKRRVEITIAGPDDAG